MSDNLSFLLTCAAECLNNWGYDGHGKHVDDGVKEITRLRAENEKLQNEVMSDYYEGLEEGAATLRERLAEADEANRRVSNENEKLRRRIHLFKNTRNEHVFGKLVKAHEEIEKLRKALKPFADEGAGLTDEHDDLPYGYGSGDCGCFTNGHLRAAAAAIRETDAL